MSDSPNNANNDNVLIRIIYLLEQYIELMVPISPQSRLIEDLQIDSFALIHFISALEETFNICITDDEITSENFSTAIKLAGYVEKKICQQ